MTDYSEEHIYILLAKKLSGEATGAELAELEELLASEKIALDDQEIFSQMWHTNYFSDFGGRVVSQTEVGDKLYKQAFINERGKKRLSVSLFLKIAASVILFFTLTYTSIVNRLTKEETVPEITLHQKETLPGQKSQIQLSDGTIAILNSGSRIFYKSDFNATNRIVELEGQAYFEVSRNENLPFIVHCQGLQIEALGTTFDINGYSNESIQISLVSGSVKVSPPLDSGHDDLILSPGEYSQYFSGENTMKKGTFDLYNTLAWKEGRLIFKNARFKEIKPKLEMWFGVKISIETRKGLNRTFTGVFERENLDNILMNMSDVIGFNYELNGNQVTIKDMPMK